MLKFEKRIDYLLHLKYRTNETIFNTNIIDNIIFNEKSHLVSKFKDFLISDDDYEFLKRYYNNEESKIRLKKFINYYHKYSLLYPNYSALIESGIIYKNINQKQKIIDELQNYNKEKDIKNNRNENLDNIVFNSKIYNSIIKSDNCLSLFSYDKESNFTDFKDEGIKELIDEIELNVNNNKTKIPQTKDNLFYKKLNINIDNLNNNNKIYTKKTLNNSINSKHINISSHSLSKSLKSHMKNDIIIKEMKIENKNKNKNISTLNNETDRLSMKNKILGIYKKINIRMLSSEKNSKHSSLKKKSKRNSFITISNNNININNKNNNKNASNITNIKEEFNRKSGKEKYKINGMPLKINVLTEQLKLPRIKVNMKKINDIKNKNSKINKKIIININKFNEFNNSPKISNNNSFCNKLYNNLNNNTFNISNISIEKNKNKILNLRNSNEKIDFNKNNIFKGNKINLTKRKEQYSQQFNYIINNYNSKLTTYNTSIQFNNNNINIINSNNNRNTIINNIYKANHFYQSNNISDFIHNTPYEKKLINENNSYNGLKNKKAKFNFLLNKKNYFSSINDNKRKKFFTKKLLDFIGKTNNSENSISKHNTSNNVLNSERLSTPFNLWKNNRIFSNKNRVSNDSYEQKCKALTTNIIKKFKSGFKKNVNNKVKDNEIKKSSIKKKFLYKENTRLNKYIGDKNNSFIKSKIDNNIFQNYSYIKKEYDHSKIKDKKNYTIFLKNNTNNNKNYEKSNDKQKTIKRIKDKKMRQIVIESKEQINKIKNDFFKKIENKYNMNKKY